MEFYDRAALMRRIVCGRLITSTIINCARTVVEFTDPTQDVLLESDQVYNRYILIAIDSGLKKQEELFEDLISQGIWSYQKEAELKILDDDINKLRKSLPALRFKKAQERATKAMLEAAQKRKIELLSIKNQSNDMSAEHFADNARRRFLISKITKLNDPSLISNNMILDKLSVCYYNDNAISEGNIRTIARTDPWRLHWALSKDTGTPLFSLPAYNITEYQYALVAWSKVYDFAFECDARPDKDIIDDDVKFDAWYESYSEHLENERKKHNKQDFGNKYGAIETFIPADKEGAKAVYELNDPVTRSRISERQKAIEKKGQITEANLPDVKRELIMEANKARRK